MDELKTNSIQNVIIQKFSMLDNSWHQSLSDCLTVWNRLLSQLQPYAHAAQIIHSENDYLLNDKYYLLFDPKSYHYLELMYLMR
jgi:hypothetical protein